MHILEMDRFRELLRIVRPNLVVLEVEENSFAVVFEDGAKDPAVAVIIGELRVLQLRIER